MDHFIIQDLIKLTTEKDVLLDGRRKDDGLLLNIGDRASFVKVARIIGYLFEDYPKETRFA